LRASRSVGSWATDEAIRNERMAAIGSSRIVSMMELMK
jgi:hypothetical protein